MIGKCVDSKMAVDVQPSRSLDRQEVNGSENWRNLTGYVPKAKILKTIINMKADGMSLELIAKYTGLTVEEVRKLK